MGDQGYDDGLVHGHSWASEQVRRPQPRHDSMPQRCEVAASMDHGYDDGLVHNHSWAHNA